MRTINTIFIPSVFRTFPFAGAPVAPTHKLKDADMALAGVTYWSVGNSATLTKSAGELSVARNAIAGVNLPYAYQYALEIGRDYTITGSARGDASAAPYYGQVPPLQRPKAIV